MWKSFVTSFNRHLFDEVAEAKAIYRDELEKKSSKKKAEKNRDRSAAYSKPLLPKEEDGKDFEKKSYGSIVGKKEVITVKVKMTKQEAARLLSKCKDGGFLDFKDAARELVHISPNRVNVVSSEAGISPVLESIPEEL